MPGSAQRANEAGARIRRAADDRERLAAIDRRSRIDGEHPQPVGIGMLLRLDHAGDGERLVGRLVVNLFNLKPDRRQPLADLLKRGLGFQMVLQPGQCEFHVSRLAILLDRQPER